MHTTGVHNRRAAHGESRKWRWHVGHDSNWAGNIGTKNQNNSASDFKAGGMSDTQAREAAAAAERQRQAQQKTTG